MGKVPHLFGVGWSLNFYPLLHPSMRKEKIAMKSWFMAGSHPQDYEAGIDSNVTYNGKNSGFIKSIVEEAKGFGTLMQMFKADDYRNKRMRFAAVVKSEEIADWAGLWMRIDGPEQGKFLGFDNMQNRPIKGTTAWQNYEVVLDVPQESVAIAFGILLRGTGQAWLSDVHFEEVSTDVPVTSLSKGAQYLGGPGNLDFTEDEA